MGRLTLDTHIKGTILNMVITATEASKVDARVFKLDFRTSDHKITPKPVLVEPNKVIGCVYKKGH
eukprot:scaffold3941_cov223-Amphora_coffeaeformis.AAC.2